MTSMSAFDPDSQWQERPLPWHETAFKKLVDARARNRLPHALLLTGVPGIGMEVFAAALAARLLCRADAATVTACGECEGCTVARGGGHGDYRWLQPEEGKRALGVDAVRSAIEFIQMTAAYGNTKVLVVSPASAMTTQAANALLKTLEEPAGDSVVLLVTSRPGDLPATVRSRCQTSVLPAPSRTEALTWLTTQLDADGDALGATLDSLDGRVLDALRLAGSDTVEQRRRLASDLSELLTGRESAVSVAGRWTSCDTEEFLELGLHTIKSCLDHADGESMRRSRAVFPLYEDGLRWLAAVRNGVNLGRDPVVLEFCQRAEGVLQR